MKRHAQLDDLWFVIKGVVYDMTKFYHPGGKKKLLEFAGKDGTEGFLKQHANPEYMNHFQDFKVGIIKLKPGEKLQWPFIKQNFVNFLFKY